MTEEEKSQLSIVSQRIEYALDACAGEPEFEGVCTRLNDALDIIEKLIWDESAEATGDKDKKSVWWREGWDAFDDFQREDNPYDYDKDLTKWSEWIDGYTEASYEKYKF